MKACPVLWLIVPCYNEQQVLPVTAPIFLGKITDLISSGSIDKASRILFVNDGSKDRTWDIIESLSCQDNHYSGISLSRNRGHQNALLAGLMEAADNCDITISMDCDGQDDINAVDAMLEEYSAGSEIVYGVRSSRENDTWFKRSTAQAFYRFMSAMGADIVYNHADYRLISSRVLKHLADFGEVNIFLRGMISLLGFRSSCVMYSRGRRTAGESHYEPRSTKI